MRAGRLNERVILYRPDLSEDGFGEERFDRCVRVGECYAEFVPGASYASVSSGEYFGEQKAVFRIRDRYVPTTGWRLDHVGGLSYRVVADGIRDRRLRMVTLTCERIND